MQCTMRPSGLSARSIGVRSVASRVVVRANFFDNLFGKPGITITNPRGAEIVDELLDVASSTSIGTKTTPGKRELITELITELRPFGIKNPARSKLLFGEYEVIYVSAPTAPGGPLAGLSRALPANGVKAPVEVLNEDGSYSSAVGFKELGILNGSFGKIGTIKPINGNSYQMDLNQSVYKPGIGSISVKQVEERFDVQLLYLGEQLRVVEVTPEDGEAVLMVMKRVGVEDDEESDDEESVSSERPGSALFRRGSRETSLATMSERQVLRQLAQEEAGRTLSIRPTARVAPVKKAGTAPAPRQAAVKEAQAKMQATRALEGIKSDEAKAGQKQGKSARNEAEDRDTGEPGLLESLGRSLKERQAGTQAAIKKLKELQRTNGSVIKKVSAAQAKVEDAEEEVEEVEGALEEAAVSVTEGKDRLREAQADLAKWQGRVKEAKATAKSVLSSRR